MVDGAEVLLALARLLASDRTDLPTCDPLCRAAVRLLEARGGALTLGLPDDRVVVAATSSVARRMEDLQDLLDEGPSVDALRRGLPCDTVTSSASAVHVAFETVAHGLLGDARVLSFPVVLDAGEVAGTLTVYADPRPWSDRRREQGVQTAVLLGALLLQDGSPDGRVPGGRWRHRAMVHQAAGLVMARGHVPEAEALRLLRAHAVGQAGGVVALARRVVERRDLSWVGRAHR